MELRTFRPGERILIREVHKSKVWTVRPVTVIEDTVEQLETYLAPGTLIDYPVAVEHGERPSQCGCQADPGVLGLKGTLLYLSSCLLHLLPPS